MRATCVFLCWVAIAAAMEATIVLPEPDITLNQS